MTTNLSVTQNFLRSRSLVKQIVQLAAIQPDSTVLEIGPGKGIITYELAQAVTTNGRVVAVELEDNFFDTLTTGFADFPQVQIVREDILDYDLAQLGRPYNVFANIPFNITAQLLEKLLTPRGPQSVFLILQKDTLIGVNKGGQETETFKSFLLAPLYQLALEYEFARADFWPKPSVSTALFSFKKRDKPLIKANQYPLYKDFLAFISRDRVGEGSWSKLFSKKQLAQIDKQTPLQFGHGLKTQSVDGIVAGFTSFATVANSKHSRVTGAMQKLRDEQARTEKLNKAGNHHRSKKKPKTK